MHIQEHVDKMMKIRKLVIDAIYPLPEGDAPPGVTRKVQLTDAKQQVIAILTQAVIISMQAEVVTDEISHLDVPRY